jgi:hypothetical protein
MAIDVISRGHSAARMLFVNVALDVPSASGMLKVSCVMKRTLLIGMLATLPSSEERSANTRVTV